MMRKAIADHSEQKKDMKKDLNKNHSGISRLKHLGLPGLFRFFDTQFQGLLDLSGNPAVKKD